MINAERILLTVDSRLDHAVRLVIYGRAAIALGFREPPADVTRSLDVDAIIPVSQIAAFQGDANFMSARTAKNLRPRNYRQTLLVT